MEDVGPHRGRAGALQQEGLRRPGGAADDRSLCVTCPKPEAAQFLEKVRGTKDGKETIKDVEESLQFEKMK